MPLLCLLWHNGNKSGIMTRKSEQEAAYRLFKENVSPQEIARKTSVPLRTVQRWFTSWRNGKLPKIDKDDQIISVTVVNNSGELATSSSELLCAEILSQHSSIRRKIAEILEQKLEEDELNYRAIAALSKIMCEHSKMEHLLGFLGLLEWNAAAQTLESAGFIISDPSEDRDVD